MQLFFFFLFQAYQNNIIVYSKVFTLESLIVMDAMLWDD